MNIVDIEILTRLLTNTDTTSLSAPNLLILDNKYYEEIVGRIISETAGSKWQFGDFNYAAFPSFTRDMTNSTAEYALRDWGTTDDETILTIMGVEVLDNNGIFHPLKRITLKEIQSGGTAQSEYSKTDGIPQEYELRDNFIILYPAPDNGVNVTLSAGLKVFHLRTADKFTSSEVSTGTKEPGFPSPWHWLMSYGPAYDYADAANLPNANRLGAKYEKGLQEMLDFISRRDQAENYKFIAKAKSFR